MASSATNLKIGSSSASTAAGVELIEDEVVAKPNLIALRDRHRTMLQLAIVVIVAAFLLQLRGSENVRLPWLRVDIPTLCGSRAFFGLECPGCGLTRSIIALASGDLKQSLKFHRLGWLMAFAIVAQIPYRLYALKEMRVQPVNRAWPTWFGNFLIAALIINWLANCVRLG